MDQLDFGWMGASAFELSERPEGVEISIVGNNQSYLLQGVSSGDLSLNNVRVLDATAASEWADFLGL